MEKFVVRIQSNTSVASNQFFTNILGPFAAKVELS